MFVSIMLCFYGSHRDKAYGLISGPTQVGP